MNLSERIEAAADELEDPYGDVLSEVAKDLRNIAASIEEEIVGENNWRRQNEELLVSLEQVTAERDALQAENIRLIGDVRADDLLGVGGEANDAA